MTEEKHSRCSTSPSLVPLCEPVPVKGRSKQRNSRFIAPSLGGKCPAGTDLQSCEAEGVVSAGELALPTPYNPQPFPTSFTSHTPHAPQRRPPCKRFADNNIIFDTDSYKSSHFLQYPKGTRKLFSYLESRGGRYPATRFFGLAIFAQALPQRVRHRRDGGGGPRPHSPRTASRFHMTAGCTL